MLGLRRRDLFQAIGNWIFPRELIATKHDPCWHLHSDIEDRTPDSDGNIQFEKIRSRIAAENIRILLRRRLALRMMLLFTIISFLLPFGLVTTLRNAETINSASIWTRDSVFVAFERWNSGPVETTFHDDQYQYDINFNKSEKTKKYEYYELGDITAIIRGTEVELHGKSAFEKNMLTFSESEISFNLSMEITELISAWGEPALTRSAENMLKLENMNTADFYVLKVFHDAGANVFLPEQALSIDEISEQDAVVIRREYVERIHDVTRNAIVAAIQAKNDEKEMDCGMESVHVMIVCNILEKI
ncbi:hypothetical protein SAMN05660653_03235 [Desulfonatronum thiosulfatophilum]|uniref:Uncharacterized protein n=1 Tax=Desulfonatronum thiosulfatophilum TaxID=617002 RepID=A0A1G6EWK2_9BACT|nr:hypothetical protein [Desulfonatronum thiosulfatophilum]SDB61783.1 hypothetical protein SAMN05660653_03235 [Desulfonatronum thiosulfatophilum]